MGKCSTDGLMGRAVTGKPVTECADLGEVFEAALPAFGGAYLKRVYEAGDRETDSAGGDVRGAGDRFRSA